MSFFKKLFGSSEEPKKETKNNSEENRFGQEEEIEDEFEDYNDEDFEEETETEEEELSDEDKKLVERERRIQEVMEVPKYHVFDDHDNSPQGQKAIKLGIHNNLRGGKATYDYTKVEGADFTWPDYDPAQIGHLEPWLCYGSKEDSGWIDLNEFPNGNERRAKAAYQTIGYLELDNPKFTYVDQNAIDELERLLSLDDATLNEEAAKVGVKSTDIYSYRDYLMGMKLEYERRYKKDLGKAQQVLDIATEMQKEEMNANIEAVKAGGLLDPIKGVSMEDWAAANAKISSGMPLDQILQILGVEKPIWDEVSAEWMSRMTQDTTFAITTVYGNAFTNSNIGKFANAGGSVPDAAGSEAVEKVKNDFEEYIKIMCHQNMASTQGLDAAAVLKIYGLSVVDWSTVSAHWAPQMGSNLELAMKMTPLMEKYNTEFAAGAAPKVADDIEF